MTDREMNRTAKDLLTVRSMIRELEAEADALTDKLKAEMVERGTEALAGDGWAATWKNVETRRFDSRLFKHNCPDLYEEYSRETTTTRFLISA